jgi:peptidoglycan/xylan/chitin deacetylase (PgdA/CDA1 family)
MAHSLRPVEAARTAPRPMTSALSIMYHDIVDADAYRASGFSGDDADMYKLEMSLFEQHLNKIAEIAGCAPSLVSSGVERPTFITFDDGGRGAITHAAAALELHGWRGHFFIATDFIGSPTFLNEAEIIELDRRGHIVGCHSASHPLRMGALTPAQLAHEWRSSSAVLADILGRQVTVASVPGGMFTLAVGVAAAQAGIEHLFTSEPVIRSWRVEKCRMYGRYTVKRGTSAETAAALLRGDRGPRYAQYALWNAKKLVKRIGGETYLRVRKKLLTK